MDEIQQKLNQTPFCLSSRLPLTLLLCTPYFPTTPLSAPVVATSPILHDCALPTTAPAALLLLVIDTHPILGTIGIARRTSRICHVAVIAANLAHNVVESIIDVYARLGRGFDEFAFELTGELLAFWRGVSRSEGGE